MLRYVVTFFVGFFIHLVFFSPSLSESNTVNAQTDNNFLIKKFTSAGQSSPLTFTADNIAAQASDVESEYLLSEHLSIEQGDLAQLATQLVKQHLNELNQAKLTLIVALWAEQEPLAALAFTLNNHNLALATMVMSKAGERQNEDILYWLTDHEQHADFIYLSQAYFKPYVEVDPLAALSTLTVFSWEIRKSLKNTVLRAWAINDAPAVLNWLSENKNGQEESSAENTTIFTATMEQYIQQSPIAAIQAVSELALSQQQKLAPLLADQLSKIDVQTALDWAATLPENLNQAAVSVILANWVNNGSAESAFGYIISQPELTNKAEMFNAAITNLVSQVPALLLTNIDEFSPDVQGRIIKQITIAKTANSASQQTDDFSYWLTQLPDFEHRDIAAKQAVDVYLQSDQVLALNIADAISSENDRFHYISKIISHWQMLDPSQAHHAIVQLDNISPTQRQYLFSLEAPVQ